MSIETNLLNGRKKYSLAVGTALLMACFGFLGFRWMMDVAHLDAFLPSTLAIISLVLAVGFFFMGLSAHTEEVASVRTHRANLESELGCPTPILVYSKPAEFEPVSFSQFCICGSPWLARTA